MNPQIKELLARAEGRYFSETEEAQLRNYVDGIPARLETMQALERAEAAILEETVATLRRHFQAMTDENGANAPSLATRDFGIVLRYAAAAHLLVSPNFIYDKLAVWYRTIIFAMVRPDMVVWGFKQLIEVTKRHLPPSDAAAITLYLQVVVDEMESNLKKEAA